MESVRGWMFKNESECFDFFKNGGKVANYRTCPTRGSTSESSSNTSSVLTLGKEECSVAAGSGWDSCCPCCPPVWDGFLCWPPSMVNTVVEQPCPANIPQLNTANFAFRNCSSSGWLQEDGLVDSARGLLVNTSRPLGFTHFQPCFDEDVIDVVKGFFNSSDADMEWKLFILNFTRMMEIVGYSVSFISIALSIFILSHFRVLRTQEKRIHFHLYLSMLIQVTVRLVIYFDQQIMKESSRENSNSSSSRVELGSSLVCIADATRNSSNVSLVERGEGEFDNRTAEDYEYKGIGNMVAVCQIAWVLLEYTRTAMFHWMFLEGLHLHNILVVNVFLTNTDTNHKVYLLVGWVAPLVSTSAWATMAFFNMEHLCWFGYNHKLFYWISEGPRLTIILVNFLFLINIIRMLYSKVGSQYSSDTNFTQIRTSVKAAIVLQPLLGITNIMQIVFNPYNSAVSYFTFWSISTAFLASFQGFFAALFYCFCNKEVQKVVRHSFLVHMSRRRTENALPARSESIKTTRVKLSFRRSNTLQKKRPSWCQEMPTTSTTGNESIGEGVGWSPRGRSLDLRACSTWGLSTVEEGAEAQPLQVVKDTQMQLEEEDGLL